MIRVGRSGDNSLLLSASVFFFARAACVFAPGSDWATILTAIGTDDELDDVEEDGEEGEKGVRSAGVPRTEEG